MFLKCVKAAPVCQPNIALPPSRYKSVNLMPLLVYKKHPRALCTVPNRRIISAARKFVSVISEIIYKKKIRFYKTFAVLCRARLRKYTVFGKANASRIENRYTDSVKTEVDITILCKVVDNGVPFGTRAE